MMLWKKMCYIGVPTLKLILVATLKLITVCNVERWRDCVSNKEISNEKVEERCTTMVEV